MQSSSTKEWRTKYNDTVLKLFAKHGAQWTIIAVEMRVKYLYNANANQISQVVHRLRPDAIKAISVAKQEASKLKPPKAVRTRLTVVNGEEVYESIIPKKWGGCPINTLPPLPCLSEPIYQIQNH